MTSKKQKRRAKTKGKQRKKQKKKKGIKLANQSRHPLSQPCKVPTGLVPYLPYMPTAAASNREPRINITTAYAARHQKQKSGCHVCALVVLFIHTLLSIVVCYPLFAVRCPTNTLMASYPCKMMDTTDNAIYLKRERNRAKEITGKLNKKKGIKISVEMKQPSHIKPPKAGLRLVIGRLDSPLQDHAQ